jgi:hypothetical protein
MRKFVLTVTVVFCTLISKAQTFSWSGYSPIRDFETDTIFIEVSGLPNAINSNFGIAGACFDIQHTYKGNLVITLLQPHGHGVVLVENHGAGSDNFTGTCVGMDGVPFELGVPPYTGNFLPVGDLSSLNDGHNPNGTWMLLVRDMSSADTGSVRSASIRFSNNPPQGNGLGGNNLGPSGPFVWPGLVCPGGTSGCDLLPDVTASAYEIQNNHYETPGFLYVSNGTPNIGYGPIEIFAIDSCFCNGVPSPCNVTCPGDGELQHMIRQRIYRKVPGTDTLAFYDHNAGAMTFHPEHGHLHVDNWADFTLRSATADPDPRNWPILGTSVKQSYCLVNLGVCSDRPGECVDNNGNTLLTVPNQGFGFRTGCGLNQGIYPGYYDVYSTSLNEPIPLTNVCNGNYYIVSITDPDNMFVESDENNNWVAVPITLTQQNAAPVISSSSSSTVCQGDSIVLTANMAPNYLWSTGDTSRSIVVKTAGTYTVSSNCGTSTSTSNPYTVTILPAGAAPSVTIAITGGSNPACAGAPITFTATPTYGGDGPAYQWKLNGTNVGTNSASYTSSSFTNGQVISCELTSNISCFALTPVLSNSIQLQVNPVGDPSLQILQTRGSNPMCLGDTATFTANVSNGTGTSYQWKINGAAVGSNSNQFSSTDLVNGQVITCDISSTAACPVKATIGNGISSNSATSCLGAAYPSYYGNGRQQYLVKASELLAMGLTAGNITTLGFTVANTVGNPQTLKGYTIKLSAIAVNDLTNTLLNPAFTTVFGPVDYTPTLNAINTHNFNTPFSWNGSSNILVDICFENLVVGRRGYQNLVTVTPFYSTSYYQADTTGGAGACNRIPASFRGTLRPNMIFSSNGIKNLSSNSITLSVNSANPPAVALEVTEGSVEQCAGTSVSFKAVPNNTGSGPAYQWTKNGVDIEGATGSTFSSSSLAHNDSIRCRMTSGLVCGTLQDVWSDAAVIKVPLPVYTFTGNGNWNVAGNWANNAIPPAKLLSCSEIIIDPPTNGECYLNQQQVIAPGAKITVVAGKKLRVQGNMLIQQ